MTFLQFASKNIRGNWHQYIAFFLSSVFSVLIFYIFSAFIYHPDVVNGYIQAADKVKYGLIACQVIILIFSLFFVLYSIHAFHKSRNKEFGLLHLFGMTRGQLNRMVIYENIGISILSIGVGIAAGILFSKLFFMALFALLDMNVPIRFYVVAKAILYTAAWFFILFMSITLMSLKRMGKMEVIELLHAAKKPKDLPKTHWLLVLLMILCLGVAYYLAYHVDMSNILMFILPVTVLVIVGTNLFFSQGTTAILRRLQASSVFYFRKTNMIIVSNMMFKIKDNARVLFIVSILSAVVMTSSATLYVISQGAKEQFMSHMPQTISYSEIGCKGHSVIDPDKIKSFMEKEGFGMEYELHVQGILATSPTHPKTVFVISEDDYNHAAKLTRGAEPVHVKRGETIFVYPYIEANDQFYSKGGEYKGTLLGKPFDIHVAGQLNGAVISPQGEASYLFIMNNEQHQDYMKAASDQEVITIHGLEPQNWEKSLPAIQKMEKELFNSQQQTDVVERVSQYLNLKQLSALTLFIGLFVSILFFIASGSMLYFKLFTELAEDRRQFNALSRIGMSVQEISRVVTMQTGVLFFIPLVVGAVHMLFAMKALSNIWNDNTIWYGVGVMGIYIVMQMIYFFAARKMYLKRVLSGIVD
ncbi:FtsX-like permease family protein [Paenibacillus sp. KN14-4R]|uniref:FtsX-like permease family protein n=1 Tax=Paenibacillus sp. KN14-4R TaxID=3445773 RepID=UPI003FA005A5